MTDINSVVEVGNLVKDCEIKTFDNGGSVINFTIAVNRSVKKGDSWEDETSFFDVRYSVKSTKVAEYLKKGTKVAVKGSLKQDRWEKDGQKNSRVVILCENLGRFNAKKEDGNTPSNSDGFPEDCPF